MRFLFLSTALLTTPVFADTIEVQAPVKAATLYYPEMAVLTREIRFQAAPGTHELLIPFHGNSYSLPFVDFDSADVEVLSSTLMQDRLPVLAGQSTDAIAAAKAKIDAIEAQIRDRQAEAGKLRLIQRGADEQIVILKALPAAGFVAGEPLAVQAEALASLTAERIAKALADSYQAGLDADAVDLARAKLEDDLTRAQQELAVPTVEPSDMAETSVIAVQVKVETSGEHALAMTDVAEAYWRPTYDVRMIRTGAVGQITLETAVQVGQISGEDWTDIALTISTAVSAGGEEIWQGGGKRWSLVSDEELAKREDERRHLEEQAAADGMVLTDDAPVVAEMPSRMAMGLNFNYRFPMPVTIRSTEQDVLRLSLGDDELTANLVAIVDEDEDTANLKAEVINTTGAPIMPGEMRLWLDGAMAGIRDEYQSDGEVIPENGKFDLWFGPIWGLTVDLSTKGDVTGRDGILISSNRRELEKSLIIRNLTKESWPVRAYLSLDYSSNEDLVIETSATPEISEKNADDSEGLAAWTFDLAAGEEKTISVKQVLTWPNGYHIE